ncbi:hypothetical protein KP509_26G065800 [Ceratopteris richardii]|nr:hypothetical protein KP509_26G065800 [Ceratopteris richardii]
MVSDERGLYGPWYFMYKESQNSEGLAYDPLARKWHNFVLPFTLPTAGPVAAFGGLVCFAENSDDYMLYLCNLMTRKLAKLPGPYEQCRSDYYAVSLNIDRVSKVQSIVVARSSRSSNDYSEWSFSVDTCSSHSQTWKNVVNTVLYGWRGGETSVICNGIFYCVRHSTAMVGNRHDECRLGLFYFDLQMEKLEIGTLPMPCPLTCVKLINCNGHLIMVGGIGKADVVRGIGIWELQAEWKEISRMPHKFFRGFGELDDVFSSSGADDLIYIHAYGSPQLLLFNIKQQSWRWSQKCPMVKKHPLHLFTGFCFQPSLHVAPWSN